MHDVHHWCPRASVRYGRSMSVAAAVLLTMVVALMGALLAILVHVVREREG